jgi:hypothetical protein
VARPRLRPTDRLLWAWLARLWPGWHKALAFVQPRTVIAWQRRRFRNYWRRLSQQGTPGRPAIAKDVRDLIRTMWQANPTWGSPRLVGFNITEHPTTQWTAQQVVEAFFWDEAPCYLLRDRDAIYGAHFRHQVQNIGIEEAVIAPRSPWQNPYVERLIGSIRRECLNHVIVLHERHLQRILAGYFVY